MTASRDASPTFRWGSSWVRRWWRESRPGLHASMLWTLVWLVALLYYPALDPASGPAAYPVGIAVIVVFVPLYLLVETGVQPLTRWAPWVTTALGLVAVPFNTGGTTLFIYAAGFAGSLLPRRAAMKWLVGLTALIVVLTVVSPVPLPWRFFVFVPPLVLVWLIGMLSVEQAAQIRATRFHNAQVEHLATLSERERISRDLHDLLGQTLTGIVVRAQLAQRLAPADAEAGIAEMAAVETAARDALSEVRATVSGWRQVDLDEEVTAARDALSSAGVTLTVRRDPGLALTPSAETALGLALREAVTNVVRHAHARHCTVVLRQHDGRVVLEIIDDGVGGDQHDGNGLTGMRERVAALGGEVQRIARHGTAVTVEVPAVVAT